MRVFTALWLIAGLFLGGCASYQMGDPAQLPYRSIAVTPPVNASTLPKLEGELNAALRKAILQTGSLELAPLGQEEATLRLTILEAKRDIAAVASTDVGRGRKFELKVDFELSLGRPGMPADGFIESRRFTIKQDIFTESGLVDAEFQASPEIARKAADMAIQIITDLW